MSNSNDTPQQERPKDLAAGLDGLIAESKSILAELRKRNQAQPAPIAADKDWKGLLQRDADERLINECEVTPMFSKPAPERNDTPQARMSFFKWATKVGLEYQPDEKWRYQSDMLQAASANDDDVWHNTNIPAKEVPEYTDIEVYNHYLKENPLPVSPPIAADADKLAIAWKILDMVGYKRHEFTDGYILKMLGGSIPAQAQPAPESGGISAQITADEKAPAEALTQLVKNGIIYNIIQKHLFFQGGTGDQWWLQASVKHYLENGKMSGSLYMAVSRAMQEYADTLTRKP